MTRLLILGTATDVAAGDRLLDACDEIAAPISFSCRNTTCGICVVRMVQGVELVAPPSADEASLLDDLRAGEGARLACQLYVTAETGTIELEPLRSSIGS